MSSQIPETGGARDAAREPAVRTNGDDDDARAIIEEAPASTSSTLPTPTPPPAPPHAPSSSSPVRSTHANVRYADFRCPICLDLLYKVK